MMKKRVIALFLVLALFLNLAPYNTVFAAENIKSEAVEESRLPQISDWALGTLYTGEAYGIYPLSWYESDMTQPVTNSQLRVLMAGVRKKILKTNCVTDADSVSLKMKEHMTVQEVVNIMYSVLASYTFTENIGLEKKYSPAAYMAEYGVFTGKEGELAYKDICTLEQACVIATRLITHVYAALDAGSKGFLWEAKHGDTTVYLLGSIHIANEEIYPFGNQIKAAFQASDVLALELNVFNSYESDEDYERRFYTDGTTLKDHIDPETYEVTILLAEYLEYPEELVKQMKPWVITNIFTTALYTEGENNSYETMFGIDVRLTVEGILSGKYIWEVEGMSSQIDMFESFSDELNELLLIDAIQAFLYRDENEDTQSYDVFLKTVLELWKAGDVEEFRRITATEEDTREDLSEYEEWIKGLQEEYDYKMMTLRDIAMAEYIDTLLQEGMGYTFFVVLGSAHYISEYSVLDILEEWGYEIKQIK